ncbi:hypothetical protein, partial [Streptomyces sp. NPDC017435]|uniref:hypothetical protein n=1 Tax=Streptomyces sp. NPDC017435 TaxID=3364995 RepID=UPI0037B4DD02
ARNYAQEARNRARHTASGARRAGGGARPADGAPRADAAAVGGRYAAPAGAAARLLRVFPLVRPAPVRRHSGPVQAAPYTARALGAPSLAARRSPRSPRAPGGAFRVFSAARRTGCAERLKAPVGDACRST